MPRLNVLSWWSSTVDRADLVVATSFALLATATFVLDRPSDVRTVPDLAVAHASLCGTQTDRIVVHVAPEREPAIVRIDVCENGVLGVDVVGSPTGTALVAANRIDGGASSPDGAADPWRVTDRFEWRRPVAAGEVWVVGRIGGEAGARAWIAGTSFEPSR